MFTLKNSVATYITRELAQRFATMKPSRTERELSKKRLTFLENRYRDGLFIPCLWSSAWLDGIEHRMNGHHSSTVLASVPEPFPTHLRVHIDEYEVEKAEDMALLFRQFDPRESSRSAKDVSGAYQGIYPELAGLPRDSTELGAKAIAWYLSTVIGIPAGKGDERYAKIYSEPVHYDFLAWLGTVLTIKTPELKRVEVVASMYATDRKNPEESHAFWEQVARGGHQYEEFHASSTADRWLKLCKEGKCEDKMKEANHYQGCIYAWNAFREGRTIKDIKFSTAKGLYEPLD